MVAVGALHYLADLALLQGQCRVLKLGHHLPGSRGVAVRAGGQAGVLAVLVHQLVKEFLRILALPQLRQQIVRQGLLLRDGRVVQRGIPVGAVLPLHRLAFHVAGEQQNVFGAVDAVVVQIGVDVVLRHRGGAVLAVQAVNEGVVPVETLHHPAEPARRQRGHGQLGLKLPGLAHGVHRLLDVRLHGGLLLLRQGVALILRVDSGLEVAGHHGHGVLLHILRQGAVRPVQGLRVAAVIVVDQKVGRVSRPVQIVHGGHLAAVYRHDHRVRGHSGRALNDIVPGRLRTVSPAAAAGKAAGGQDGRQARRDQSLPDFHGFFAP